MNEQQPNAAHPAGLVAMSDAQLERLLKASTLGDSFGGHRKMKPREVGFGAAPETHIRGEAVKLGGLGAPYDCQVDPSVASDVYMFLRLGSPRLALARAWGVPMAPYAINCRATFPTVDTSELIQVSNDQKIVQDTYVDCVVARVTNLSSTANQNQLQTLSDFFYNFQNGLTSDLTVVGAPRFSIAPSQTPISTLADVINGSSRWGNGWVLTYQQQIVMQFQAAIALPTAPIELCFTYRTWIPTNDMFVDMRNRDAVAQLRAEGFWIPDTYLDRVLR